MSRPVFIRAVALASVLLAASWLASGCKRGVTSKGTGDGANGSLASPFTEADGGPRTRTVLIIGNSRYAKLKRLEACRNDAASMAAAFRQVGIALHGGKPQLDLSTDQMDAAIAEFARSLDRGSEAYLYYSGHGAQIGGSNYLLPVNFDAQYEAQAKRQAISLDAVLETLEKTTPRLLMVILDACRDPGNFLPGEPLTKSSLHAKGLEEQRVEAPETLVCFATKHGTVSLADDDASYYSRVLAEEMVKPGRVEDVLRLVARRVYQTTEKRQQPFTYGSLLQDHFFVRPSPAESPKPAVAQVPAATPFPTPQTQRPAATPEPMEMVKLTQPAPAPARPQSESPPMNRAPSPAAATKDVPFINSLGMEFVPVPGTRLLFCRWETRVKDYRAFAAATRYEVKKADFAQTDDHPAVNVSLDDAKEFCGWLSTKEGRQYRLPTDHEWSVAVGIGDREDPKALPKDKSAKIADVFPWGTQWPPPKGAGNYVGEETPHSFKITGYNDGYEYTAPAGSFTANRFGIYDLGGNVWEWCSESVLRGSSFRNNDRDYLLSSFRRDFFHAMRLDSYGFRVVLVGASPDR